MTDDKNTKTTNLKTDSTKSLLGILQGNSADIKIPYKPIITGKKLKNSALRDFVKSFKEDGTMESDKLLEVILMLDEMVESGKLTEEILETMRKDPSILFKS